MIKKLFHFFLIFLILSPATAGTYPDPDLSGAEQEIYFSGLSSSQSPESWYARTRGMMEQLPEWERDSWMQKVESELLGWADYQLQHTLTAADMKGLINTMDQLNKDYLYQSDSGEILFDSEGDPLIRSVTPEDIAQDRQDWQDAVRTKQEALIEEWTLSGEALLTEVLHRIPPEHRDEISSSMAVKFSRYRQAVRREAEGLIQWSLRKFDYTRNEDNYSLRNKNEGDSAGSLAENLIRETRNDLAVTEAVLKQGMDQLQETAVEEASFSVDQWEESFQREFQKGLEKWDRAEQSLLAQRVDWELRVETKYLEAEKSWDAAFETFAASRKEWIAGITRILQEGQQAWEEKENAGLEQFNRISAEIESAALEEERRFRSQVQTAIGVYRESAAMLDTTAENIQFYERYKHDYDRRIGRYDRNVRSALEDVLDRCSGDNVYGQYLRYFMYSWPSDQAFLDFHTEIGDLYKTAEGIPAEWELTITLQGDVILDAGDGSAPETQARQILLFLTDLAAQEEDSSLRRNKILKEKKDLEGRVESLQRYQSSYNPYLEEYNNWVSLDTHFRQQIADTQAILASLASEATGFDDSVPAGSLENEIRRMENQADRLYIQTQVSEAVVRYAETLSSLRPTEAQTRLEYQQADRALKEAESSYLEAINTLGTLRQDLSDSQISVSQAREKLSDARRATEEARVNYETSLAIFNNNDPEVIEIRIKDLEEQINRYFDGSGDTDPRRKELYTRFVAASEWEFRQEAEETRQTALRDLMGEEKVGEFDEEPNRQDILDRIDAVTGLRPYPAAYDQGLWEAGLLTAGFAADTQEFALLSQLYKDAFSPEATLSGALKLESTLTALLLEQEKALAWNEEAEKWLTLASPPGDASLEEMEQTLAQGRDAAENALYRAAAALLADLAGHQLAMTLPSEDRAPLLDYLGNIGYSFTAEDLTALQGLSASLQALSEGSTTRQDILAGADAASLGWLKVITGAGGTAFPAADLLRIFLQDEQEAADRAEQSLLAFKGLSGYSRAYQLETLQKTTLLDSATGEEFLRKIEEIDTLEELESYLRVYTDSYKTPNHLDKSLRTLLSLRLGSLLSAADLDTTALAALTEAWPEKKAELEADPLGADALTYYLDEGVEGVFDLLCYGLVPLWTARKDQAYQDAVAEAEALVEGTDPPEEPVVIEPDYDELWVEFLAEQETYGQSITRTDLAAHDFAAKDYAGWEQYNGLTGMTVEEYVAATWSSAGAAEQAYIAALIESGGDRIAAAAGMPARFARLFLGELEERNSRNEMLLTVQQTMQGLAAYEAERENPEGETAFFSQLLTDSVESLFGADPEVPASTSRSILAGIVDETQQMKAHTRLLAKLRQDLTLSAQNIQAYYRDVVLRDKEIYERLRSSMAVEKGLYDQAVLDFAAVTEEFRLAQQSLDDQKVLYRQANIRHQTAREILDYAASVYQPDSLDIYALRDERQEAYDRALASLDVLGDIRDSGETAPQIDSSYQQYVNQSVLSQSLMNTMGYASDELTKNLEDVTAKYNKSIKSLERSVSGFFTTSFSGVSTDLSFQYDPDNIHRPMTSFSGVSGSGIDTAAENYFKAANAQETFSKDMYQWISRMNSQGNLSSLLQQFSYAFYHEMFHALPEADFKKYQAFILSDSNQQMQDLIGRRKSFFKSARIGFKGDVATYNAGGYKDADIDQVVVNWDDGGSVSKVYITGHRWLADQTAGHHSSLMSNGQLRELYSFYKVMLHSGMMNQDLVRAMSGDLSGVAYYHIDEVAYKAQRKFKRKIFGGYKKPGREIRELRRNLEKAAGTYTGITRRNNLSSTLSGTMAIYSNTVSYKNQMDTLIGENPTIDSLITTIGNMTGDSLAPHRAALASAFGNLSSLYRQNNLMALSGLIGEMQSNKFQQDGYAVTRQRELEMERSGAYRDLLAALSDPEWDEDAYRQTALNLYRNPSYEAAGYYGWQKTRIETGTVSHNEKYRAETIAGLALNLEQTFRSRLETVKQTRYAALQADLEELRRKKLYWSDMTNQLVDAGVVEWTRTTEKLIGMREKWRGDFKRQYDSRSALWDLKYNKLVSNKNAWLEGSSDRAVEAGIRSFAGDMGLDADRLIGEVAFTLVPEMTIDPGSASDMVEEAMGGSTVHRLMDSVRSLTARSESHDFVLASYIPSLKDTTSQMDSILDKQGELKENLQKHLALAQALKMVDVLGEMDTMVEESVDDANKSVENSVEGQMLGAGYTIRGDIYYRRGVIDSSLIGGPESEDHEIGVYEDFEAPSFNHGVNLSIGKLKQLDSGLIQARIQKAQNNVQDYLALVFGNDDDVDRGRLDNTFISFLEEQEAAFEASARYGEAVLDAEDNPVLDDEGNAKTFMTDKKGLFNFHVGYVPEMKKDLPEEVETAGYGEMGRIYELFFIQQARLGRGLSTMNIPWYSQKIWDDDADNDGDSDGLIGAPTVRSVTDIAVGITVTALTGGAGGVLLAAALSMVDDAIFTAMDVSNGVMDAGQAWGNFAKKGATAIVSQYTGQAMQALDSTLTFGTSNFSGQFLEVSTDIGIAGATAAANTYSSAAINSYQFGEGMDWNSFNSMTSWENTGASYLSSMAGAGVTSTLDLGAFGYMKETKVNASALSGLAGGLTSSAIQYGMTGETTLNVMNFGMFGIEGKNGLVQSGLLEMNLGGKGSLFNLGTGGTDVSMGTLAQAAAGFDIYKQNRKIRQSGVDRDLVAGMRTLYSAEMDETSTLYDDILEGRAMFTTGRGQKYEGYTTVNDDGVRMIDLNMDGKSSLDLAVLMSHEAFRDGKDGGEFGQKRETFQAVEGHMNVSSALQSDYGASSLNERNNQEAFIYKQYLAGNISRADLVRYTENSYDSSSDFWKLTTDGRLINDNDADLYLTNTNGDYIDANGDVVDKKDAVKLIDTDTNSVSRALIQYVGMDRAAEMLGVNPADLGNYDEQTLQDVLGMSSDLVARTAVNGQLSFDNLTLDEQQKLMGELLMKSNEQSWDAGEGWTGDSIAEFRITDDWNGYSIGFDQTMTDGEYDKFVVDIVHSRDAMSYFGSLGNQDYKEKYNGLDSSTYTKKDFDGNIISSFSVDEVQTVDNLWSSSYDNTTVQHPFFGDIQGNTLASNSPFFSTFGMFSESYDSDVFISNQAITLSGIELTNKGQDPSIVGWSKRWLTHQYSPAQNPWLSSDGCIVNTDENTQFINSSLNSWQLYNGFNMGTVINEDWSQLYRNLYGY